MSQRNVEGCCACPCPCHSYQAQAYTYDSTSFVKYHWSSDISDLNGKGNADTSSSTQEIIKPENDPKQYRSFMLPNKLKGIVISDPDTDKAAGALSVLAGSMQDPVSLPGLAHFCEHMVFLGNEKYPQENFLGKFLSANAGDYNAFTQRDLTNFYFDVSPAFLPEALDRFAHLFINPLFTEKSAEREVSAINSEHEKNITNDYERRALVDNTLSRDNHPYAKFDCGNTLTLWTAPRRKSINVMHELRKFFDTCYSANLMCLAVIGTQSCDELQKMVESRFSSIKNTDLQIPVWPESPYGPDELMTRIDLVPIMDGNNVYLSFPVPDLTEHDKTGVVNYVGFLLSHEGMGSFAAYLKKKRWSTNGLYASYERPGKGFAFLSLEIDLTEAGIMELENVLLSLFQYLALIRKEGPQKRIWDEIKVMNDIDFRFSHKEDAILLVESLALTMPYFRSRDVLLVKYSVIDDYRPDLIVQLLDVLVPTNMRIIVSTKANDAVADQSEKWYGAKYKYSKISKSSLEKWKNCGLNPELRLPEPNPFLPTSFEMKPRDPLSTQKSPRLIKEDVLSQVWYLQDNEYKLPQANIMLVIFTPLPTEDPRSYNLNELLARGVIDSVTEYCSNADKAGLGYELDVSLAGITLVVSGYDCKISYLFEYLLKHLLYFRPQGDRFEDIKDDYVRELENFKEDEPYSHALSYVYDLLRQNSWSNDTLLQDMNDSHYRSGDLAAYVGKVFTGVKLKWLFHGNLTEQEALETYQNCCSHFQNIGALPLSPAQWHKVRQRSREAIIPAGTINIYPRPHHTHWNSATVLLLQCGAGGKRERVILDLAENLLAQPAYDILRTQEQLGYVVLTYTRKSRGTTALMVIVQGERHPAYLDDRIENFLRNVSKAVDKLGMEQFRENVEAVIVKKAEKFTEMIALGLSLFDEIIRETYCFTRDEEEIEELKTVELSELQEFFREWISASSPKRKKLSIQVASEVDDPEKIDQHMRRTKTDSFQQDHARRQQQGQKTGRKSHGEDVTDSASDSSFKSVKSQHSHLGLSADVDEQGRRKSAHTKRASVGKYFKPSGPSDKPGRISTASAYKVQPAVSFDPYAGSLASDKEEAAHAPGTLESMASSVHAFARKLTESMFASPKRSEKEVVTEQEMEEDKREEMRGERKKEEAGRSGFAKKLSETMFKSPRKDGSRPESATPSNHGFARKVTESMFMAPNQRVESTYEHPSTSDHGFARKLTESMFAPPAATSEAPEQAPPKTQGFASRLTGNMFKSPIKLSLADAQKQGVNEGETSTAQNPVADSSAHAGHSTAGTNSTGFIDDVTSPASRTSMASSNKSTSTRRKKYKKSARASATGSSRRNKLHKRPSANGSLSHMYNTCHFYPKISINPRRSVKYSQRLGLHLKKLVKMAPNRSVSASGPAVNGNQGGPNVTVVDSFLLPHSNEGVGTSDGARHPVEDNKANDGTLVKREGSNLSIIGHWVRNLVGKELKEAKKKNPKLLENVSDKRVTDVVLSAIRHSLTKDQDSQYSSQMTPANSNMPEQFMAQYQKRHPKDKKKRKADTSSSSPPPNNNQEQRSKSPYQGDEHNTVQLKWSPSPIQIYPISEKQPELSDTESPEETTSRVEGHPNPEATESSPGVFTKLSLMLTTSPKAELEVPQKTDAGEGRPPMQIINRISQLLTTGPLKLPQPAVDNVKEDKLTGTDGDLPPCLTELPPNCQPETSTASTDPDENLIPVITAPKQDESVETKVNEAKTESTQAKAEQKTRAVPDSVESKLHQDKTRKTSTESNLKAGTAGPPVPLFKGMTAAAYQEVVEDMKGPAEKAPNATAQAQKRQEKAGTTKDGKVSPKKFPKAVTSKAPENVVTGSTAVSPPQNVEGKKNNRPFSKTPSSSSSGYASLHSNKSITKSPQVSNEGQKSKGSTGSTALAGVDGAPGTPTGTTPITAESAKNQSGKRKSIKDDPKGKVSQSSAETTGVRGIGGKLNKDPRGSKSSRTSELPGKPNAAGSSNGSVNDDKKRNSSVKDNPIKISSPAASVEATKSPNNALAGGRRSTIDKSVRPPDLKPQPNARGSLATQSKDSPNKSSARGSADSKRITPTVAAVSQVLTEAVQGLTSAEPSEDGAAPRNSEEIAEAPGGETKSKAEPGASPISEGTDAAVRKESGADASGKMDQNIDAAAAKKIPNETAITDVPITSPTETVTAPEIVIIPASDSGSVTANLQQPSMTSEDNLGFHSPIHESETNLAGKSAAVPEKQVETANSEGRLPLPMKEIGNTESPQKSAEGSGNNDSPTEAPISSDMNEGVRTSLDAQKDEFTGFSTDGIGLNPTDGSAIDPISESAAKNLGDKNAVAHADEVIIVPPDTMAIVPNDKVTIIPADKVVILPTENVAIVPHEKIITNHQDESAVSPVERTDSAVGKENISESIQTPVSDSNVMDALKQGDETESGTPSRRESATATREGEISKPLADLFVFSKDLPGGHRRASATSGTHGRVSRPRLDEGFRSSRVSQLPSISEGSQSAVRSSSKPPEDPSKNASDESSTNMSRPVNIIRDVEAWKKSLEYYPYPSPVMLPTLKAQNEKEKKWCGSVDSSYNYSVNNDNQSFFNCNNVQDLAGSQFNCERHTVHYGCQLPQTITCEVRPRPHIHCPQCPFHCTQHPNCEF